MRICETELCSGCGACAVVCPKSAIEMIADDEGFLRPAVDNEKCVECGLCQKKCPVNNRESVLCKASFAAYAKDKSIRERSSSGGIFYYLAKAVLDEGGVVIGAGYSENLAVIHKAIETKEELFELMGSKYVQSRAFEAYDSIGKYLREGRKVLFSGTPCQCSAVRNIYGYSEDLILCDFICHGVPSPVVWEKFINENFEGAKTASFRNKKRGWQEFSMAVESVKEKYNVSLYKDPYLRMFLSNIDLRPSCHKCAFKGDNYASDITLADFWGISKVFPEMNDDKGVSAVIVRSEKAEGMLEKANIVKKPVSVSKIAAINTAYGESAKVHPKREAFFEDVSNDMSFAELSKKYSKPVPSSEIMKVRVRNKAKKLLSKVYKLKNRG